MRKRRKPKAAEPSPFMQEAEAFVNREPVGTSLPASCVQMLLDALDVFEEEPELRERSEYAFKGVKEFWGFSLLGFIVAEAGLDLVSMPRNAQSIPVREFLSKIGFTYYDQMCLREINHHSLNADVLRERVMRFATTGERMPFIDEFAGHERDT